MKIGEAIKHIRTQRGMTQSELAQSSGLSRTSLCQIETGLTKPHNANFEKICKSLSVSPSAVYLYGLTKEDVPESKKELFEHLKPILQDIVDKLVLK